MDQTKNSSQPHSKPLAHADFHHTQVNMLMNAKSPGNSEKQKKKHVHDTDDWPIGTHTSP